MHLIMNNKRQTLCGDVVNKLHIVYISAKCTNKAKSRNYQVFLLHSYLALCQRRGSSQFSMHRNRTNFTTEEGVFMVHLIDHVTVFLCTIQTRIY